MTSKERRQQRYLKKMLENQMEYHTENRRQVNKETGDKIKERVNEKLRKQNTPTEDKPISPTGGRRTWLTRKD